MDFIRPSQFPGILISLAKGCPRPWGKVAQFWQSIESNGG
jgi:hypothetical protein